MRNLHTLPDNPSFWRESQPFLLTIGEENHIQNSYLNS